MVVVVVGLVGRIQKQSGIHDLSNVPVGASVGVNEGVWVGGSVGVGVGIGVGT